ncbi:PP-loop family-domain-containing protein [Mycena haematopus]|nr:PP-loop family-domain-containing protein [Mycena haematopus]
MTLPFRQLKPSPISRDEFARLLQKCAPSVGWSKKIGAYTSASVAHSGGSDSTCLLFLIHRYVQDLAKEVRRPRPASIVSMTINHGLQASSDAMAKHCADYAQSLGIEHFSAKIPWSEPPFPEKPQPGDAFEELGRRSRYHILFQAMKQTGADILALGHHGDDQVETSLIRLSKGTTELGAGGMRKVRRWGMGVNKQGVENVLGWAGVEGMKMWMVRPLLEVSKERILATCQENNLEYVEDSTNFQPELTLRNAIRHLLSKNTLDPESIGLELPPHIAESVNKLQTGLSSLESVDLDPSEGLDQLRSSVHILTEQVEDIENQVDSCLNRCHLPSPPATYLVSYRGLSTIRNPLVKRSVVLRIMRYISFHAWGSLRSDADRRQKSVDLIIKNLWTPDPFAAGVAPFVAGGGVWWMPAVVGKKHLRLSERGAPAPEVRPGDLVGWLACRQPPLGRSRLDALDRYNPIWVDITDQLRAKLASSTKHANGGEKLSILWDSRFLVHIDMDKIPDNIVRAIVDEGDRLQIHPHTRWYWPMVVHCKPALARPGRRVETVLHNTLSTSNPGLVKLDRDATASWAHYQLEPVTSDWIELEWIRSLSGL